MLTDVFSKRPCGSRVACKAAASTQSTCNSCVRVVQHAAQAHATSSCTGLQPGDKVVGKVVSTGPRGSRVRLQQGNVGFLPHKLGPLHLQHSTHTYAPSTYKGRQLGDSCWPSVGLVREFQVEKNEQQSPLLSASHVDYAVMYKRAQQVADLCEESSMVLAARVTRVHTHGLHASCAGVGDGFIPIGLLPKDLRSLFAEQRAHELVGRELPVTVDEVLPDQHRIRFNCIAAMAAQRAALQPADLITGVVTEVSRTYAWVAMRGLELGGFRAMLHRNDFSCSQHFRSLQDVLSAGECITAMLLRCEEGGKRINLSTAHLELAAGDMLTDRQAVYATAAQQAQLVKQQMQQAQAQQEAAAAAAAAAATAAAEAEALRQQQAELRQQQQLAARIKQAQPQNGYARVLITDSLYQLALSSREYLAGAAAGAGVGAVGRPAMAVMAAAFWQAPSNGWQADSAAESASSAASVGDALASQDQEQEWWCSGPLAWKAADEREQWQAECQAAAARTVAAAAAANVCGGNGKDGTSGQQLKFEDGVDGEQQWLQPPLSDWEQGP